MPKGYFSPEHAVSLKSLPLDAKIHVVGVSGVAMAQLAVALAEAGYDVSGSDKEFYEPMGSYLRSSKVKLCEGYAVTNIPADVAAVVIGNAISYGHPEVAVVEERKLPYSFFPKLLCELIIEGRHSIVVSGTHGKSTTSAMIATVLSGMGLDPSYFIGGVVRDLPVSLRRGGGRFSVVEGDEYDSAFFAKVPKFDFYAPDTWLVTSIEFDHADIYSSLADIQAAFTRRVKTLPPEATVVYCSDAPDVRELVATWEKMARCRFFSYGSTEAADYRLEEVVSGPGGQAITALFPAGRKVQFQVQVPGAHNALNALAVLAVVDRAGLSLERSIELLSKFQGVKRRQEVRFDRGVTLIEDFAHHPTAVRETIAAIRRAYPGRRLWAVFEPRSNTSRKKVFQKAYVQAFEEADLALMSVPLLRANDSQADLLDVTELAQDISSSGTPCRALPDAAAIETLLREELKPGDVALIMSNGSFGGLNEKLTAWAHATF